MAALPGTGKAVRARALGVQQAGLRLPPDAWMVPLFGDSTAGGQRNVLECRLVAVALDVLRLGTNVVPDFDLWSRIHLVTMTEADVARWPSLTADDLRYGYRSGLFAAGTQR